MSGVLTQEEVDALLRGLSGGEIETEAEKYDPSGIALYDLTSQDRIIRGRMPTLEMVHEKFARIFRTTMSSLVRKLVNISLLSVSMVKFGEFLKTLPVPTSLHLIKFEPLRGSGILVVEPKIIFTLVDILFGGSGKEPFKIEGREFTAIESTLVKKVVTSAISDLEKVWKTLTDVRIIYQKSEMNPQFVQIVPPTDVIVVVNFEIEIEDKSGIISLCIPYSTLEPIRDKLQAGFQSEQLDVDVAWMNRFKKELVLSKVNLVIELGRTHINGRNMVNLKKDDVILLDHHSSDPLSVFVEGIVKFRGYPGNYKGNQAIQISQVVAQGEVADYGTE